MAICQRCGGTINEGESFCSRCGAPAAANFDASAQQSYGYPAQPAYGYTQQVPFYTDPSYAYGQGYAQPVQAVIDPNTGAGVQIYSQQAAMPAYPAMPQPEPEPKPDPNSPEGRAIAQAAPIEFALKANKVGIPVFFGCGYNPMSLESTQKAYGEVYRAMGIEAQMSSQMAAQMVAYRKGYSEMLAAMPQPAPQPEPQPIQWPFPYPQAAQPQPAPEAEHAKEEAPAEAEAEPVAEEPAEETVDEEPVLTKEEKRRLKEEKRAEKKKLRKVSAFD